MRKTICHIAAIPLSEESGMGRIACNWKLAFESQGHAFIHVGIKECPPPLHYTLWGYNALRYVRINNLNPDLFLVHEPASGFFAKKGVPMALFSHGIEPRGWEVEQHFHYYSRTYKSYLLPKTLRYWSNGRGLRYADKLLLSNQEDKNYALNLYHRQEKDIYIFQNGYYSNLIPKNITHPIKEELIFLFNASWLPRKGKELLVKAFEQIFVSGYQNWKLILAGTGANEEKVRSDFPAMLQSCLQVISQFTREEENQLYQQADVFILPSYFEGQSLALTQAMASGLCCICSDNCGQVDFIKNFENGLLFKTGDSNSLAKQISWVFNNRSLVKDFGNNAYRSVEYLNWNSVSNDLVNICCELA
jgi:glycosyltransferase involved in cell wall biosynthesis